MVLRSLALAALLFTGAAQAQEPTKVPARLPAKKQPVTPQATTEPVTVPAVKQSPMGNVLRAKVGWLGFRTDPNDRDVILEVAPDSPAEGAGIRPGDRIVSSDPLHDPMLSRDTSRAGKTVATRSPLGPIAGRTYHMTLQRGEETFAVSMVAVAPPESQFVGLRPTRATRSKPDTLRAEVDAYRTELARTTLQPAGKLTTAASPREPFASGTKEALLLQAYERTRARLENLQGSDLETYASLERNAQSLNRSIRLFATRANAVSGAEFEQLNPALGQYFGGVSEGVFVLRVSAESPAAIAGLEPGDIVERVNGEQVATIASLRERVASATGTITLSVIRKGRPATITLRKEE